MKLANSPNTSAEPLNLDQHFETFRKGIIGQNTTFDGPYGTKSILYADWTASGRLYDPIEQFMLKNIAPLVANTHTETNYTGSSMTLAYKKARSIIKEHVGAQSRDVLISSNSGMTGVVNKFQRILGLKIYEKYRDQIQIPEADRPVVFITHMEHHSNQTSWLETIADVEIIQPTADGLVELQSLEELLKKYAHRKVKYAAVTSCSNVTGIRTPYYEMAELMHQHGGYIFVDFACSAPYIEINMHPEHPEQYLDAIFFSPHKYLGGPGSSGILIFNPVLYKNRVPDNPGGGTVNWTNPWGGHTYLEEIEWREDGGTPAFLQTIRVALSCQLKDQMGVSHILAKEEELLEVLWPLLDEVPGLVTLASQHRERLGVISFYIKGMHFNLGVKLLNDRFGIQVRGGCSCAGTYGHYLLEVSEQTSHSITDKIDHGDLTEKPGWIRLSIHPTMTKAEMSYIGEALKSIAENHKNWGKAYDYDPHTNEFKHPKDAQVEHMIEQWFKS